MEEKAFGKEIAAVGTVILYRINVAMAAILVFINVQVFVGLLMDEYADFPIITLSILLACIIYGFVAVNFMITKIKIFANGLEYRSLFKHRFISSQDIKHTEFYRKDRLRMRITIHMKQGNPMVINIAKYKDNQPIVDFLADFKKKDM